MSHKQEKLNEFHRRNIIETAKKLFIEKGVFQTTMDDIAKEADYSKSTIYVYFKSKDEICSQIAYEDMLSFKQILIDVTQKNDSLEVAFMEICNAYVSFYTKNYFKRTVGSITEPQVVSPTRKASFELGKEIHKVIMDFLDHRIETKEIKPEIDTFQMSFVLLASLFGLVEMTYYRSPYNEYMKISKQEFLDYGFKTLLNSIKR